MSTDPMNPPTDRERPALSEVDRKFGPNRCLLTVAQWMSRTPMTPELKEALNATLRMAQEPSPKPALTQGGVVELAELVEAYRVRVLRVMNRNKMVSDVGLAILIAKDLAATALERLAGERGGEADYYPSHEALSDLVHLLAEEDFLGRNHGWKERWDRALSVATDLVRVEP